MIGLSPEDWYEKARAATQMGDPMAALNVLQSGVAAHPNSALLEHATGSVFMMQGRAGEAAEHFGRAHSLEPKNFDHAVDQAIALTESGRNSEALAVLTKVEKKGARFAHYCSTRANAERGAGNGAKAALWYDRALKIEPDRPKALLGRANVALERGESSAVKRFDKALSVDPANPMIQMGRAQALEMAGDFDAAIAELDRVTDAHPQFTDALHLKAQLRHARGEEDFASHFDKAVKRAPDHSNILSSWCIALAGMDCEAEAMEVAAQARAAFPDEPYFAMLEAVYAGAAGDHARAEGIFESGSAAGNDCDVHEARHRVRQGDYDRAEALLENFLNDRPDSIDGWSLRGIVWRLLDDPRADWLHEQASMVELMPLNARSGLIDKVVRSLRKLHEASTMHLGQALRGGTQTRGALFQRADPALTELHEAARKALQRYRAGLPEMDETHPLLRHFDTPWRITGAWSVRMTGNGGHHRSHIHPEGIVSSALYLVVPDEVQEDGQRGWLELGRPPADLGLDLPPLRVIQPQTGHLALFPSTLYHNTTPFETAERLTVAFDVAAEPR